MRLLLLGCRAGQMLFIHMYESIHKLNLSSVINKNSLDCIQYEKVKLDSILQAYFISLCMKVWYELSTSKLSTSKLSTEHRSAKEIYQMRADMMRFKKMLCLWNYLYMLERYGVQCSYKCNNVHIINIRFGRVFRWIDKMKKKSFD